MSSLNGVSSFLADGDAIYMANNHWGSLDCSKQFDGEIGWILFKLAFSTRIKHTAKLYKDPSRSTDQLNQAEKKCGMYHVTLMLWQSEIF